MACWTDPKIYTESCSRGEEVTVVDRDNILRSGGKIRNRVTHRMIICDKTGLDGAEFQLTQREPWMCEDCNLAT